MKKNVLYLIITLVAVILVALMMNPGNQQQDAAVAPEATPANGMVDSTGDAADMDAATTAPADAASGEPAALMMDAAPADAAMEEPPTDVPPVAETAPAMDAAPAAPAAPAGQ